MAWTVKTSAGKYLGKYRGPDKKVRTVEGGPFIHKREAEREAARAEAESRSLGWRDPQAAGRTWREWCEQWWPSRGVAASTDRSDAGRRDNHLMPRWGDVPLIDITRQDVKDWAAALRDGPDGDGGLAPATVIQVVGLLSRSLRGAVDAEVLPYNVADKLKLPKPAPGKERFLTREQVFKLLAELDGVHLAMTKLLVGTGMRWGEAAGLHRDRVHPDRRVVDVIEAFDSTAYKVSPLPKDKQIRTVPVPEWIDLSTLEQDDERDEGDERREDNAGTCGYDHTEGHCPGPLLLTTKSGTILDYWNFQKVFSAAVARAKIGHVRIHDLRHTYASWLLQNGRSLAEVGDLLGHASPLTTQRYARLGEIASQDVLDALGPDPTTPPPATAKKPVDELAARRARRSASA